MTRCGQSGSDSDHVLQPAVTMTVAKVAAGSLAILEPTLVGFAGTHAQRAFKIENKDLAIANSPFCSRFRRGPITRDP